MARNHSVSKLAMSLPHGITHEAGKTEEIPENSEIISVSLDLADSVFRECGGAMEVIAFLSDFSVVDRIISHRSRKGVSYPISRFCERCALPAELTAPPILNHRGTFFSFWKRIEKNEQNLKRDVERS